MASKLHYLRAAWCGLCTCLRLPGVLLPGLLLLVVPATELQAQAPPSALGTYDGSFSGNDFNCTDALDNGPFNGTVSVTIDNQQGSSFSGSGTIVNADDGSTDAVLISGSIAADGSISATLSVTDPTDPSSAQLIGSLSGDVLTFNFSGSDSFCSFSGSITARRGATTALPENVPASVVTTLADLNSALRTVSGALGTRVGAILRGGLRGRRSRGGSGSGARRISGGFMLDREMQGLSAAGGESIPMGVWGSYSHSGSEDDFVSTAFSSTRHSVLGGLDLSPTPNTVFGIAIGFDDSNTKTRFNNGGQDITGLTVAPYAGAIINDTVSVDVSAGYSDVRIRQFRTVPGSATQVSSELDARRLFASGNLTATANLGRWLLSGTTGLMYATERQDAFVESDGTAIGSSRFRLGQVRIGGEVAYGGDVFEPYGSAVYERDFSRTRTAFTAGVPDPGNDLDDVLLGLGIRFYDDDFSGSLEYSKVLGREHFDENTFSFAARWAF